MGIDLSKGGRINLAKSNPGLMKIGFGLGWNANLTNTGKDFDLDASLFICKEDANAPTGALLLSDKHFIFYGNLTDPDGAIRHSGDNRTGDAAGDDETIHVDLSKLPVGAAELSFIVTIHDAQQRKQNFGQVNKSFIRMYDDVTGVEIAKYSLEDDFSSETAVQFGSLVKNATGEWVFRAVGTGYSKGLADFVQIYGGNVA